MQPDDTAGFADLPTLRMRLNLLRIPALAADGDGRYVAVNDAAAALTGFAVHELEAMTVWDLTPVPQSEAGARLWSDS